MSCAMTAKQHESSKCIIVGHSFGGMIVERTMTRALTGLLTVNEEEGFRPPADLILMVNPAEAGINAKQFVDILRDSRAEMVVENMDGDRVSVNGPLIASVTSVGDWATRLVLPFGLRMGTLTQRFRHYPNKARPTQKYHSLHSAGHFEHLHSHTVHLEDGHAVLERREGSVNETPLLDHECAQGGHSRSQRYLASGIHQPGDRSHEAERSVPA